MSGDKRRQQSSSSAEEKNGNSMNAMEQDGGDKPNRYMPSVFTECDVLKQNYDNCFTRFFQHYVHPDYNHTEATNPCLREQTVYRECLEKNLAKNRPYEIDLDELRKQVLFTPRDRFHPMAEPSTTSDSRPKTTTTIKGQ